MIPISKPLITDEDKQAVMAVLDSGMLVQGPRVAELEAAWAEVCGVKHAVATSNGTTALHVALLAHGIGPGDEVITTPFTFIASVNSILFTGATPVFVDICAENFNINADLIEAAITPRTRAILPVHLFGRPARMDAILELAARHGLVVIEDAAQAIGASVDGRMCGSFGAGCFSLYATKNVMSAEGGMITSNDDAFARRCRLLRAHGMERRYHHDLLGYNFRMSDLHAAIGLSQLRRLDQFTRLRRENAAYLSRSIATPHAVVPLVDDGIGHAWHQYTVRIAGMERDAAVAQLTAAGVGSGVFYPIPAHRQAHIIERGLDRGVHLPEAERAAREVLSLPVHPALTASELETIARSVNELHP